MSTTPLATSSSNLIQVDPVSGELSEFSGATLISDVNSLITTFTNNVNSTVSTFMKGPTFNNATFNNATINNSPSISCTSLTTNEIISNVSPNTNYFKLEDTIAGGNGEMSLCSSYVNLLNNTISYTPSSNFPILACQTDGNLLIEINDIPGSVLQTSWQKNTITTQYAINANTIYLNPTPTPLPNGNILANGVSGGIPPTSSIKNLTNPSYSNTYYYDYGSGGNIGTNFYMNTTNYSLIATTNMLAPVYEVYSDERIKTNITDIDNKNALDIIRKLQPKKYTYKDFVNKGNKPKWGFIAQEVKSVIENSTNIVTEFIPDIYEIANVLNSFSNTIKLDTKTTINFEINEKIRLIYNDGKSLDTKITGILDNYTFTIEENINQEQIFVYGREVHDLHTLDKDVIFTIATAALKEVDKELQNEKVLRQQLENKFIELENKFIELENKFKK